MNQVLTIRENSYVLDKDDFNVAGVCREALSRVQYKLNNCPHAVSTSIDNSISMYSNRSYLFEILKNLLSNAIKFRKKGEVLKLELNVQRRKNSIELVLKDNGIGMDMKLVKKDLFRLYRKFHPGYDGRGIGLFLVKTYVDALGGRINVASAPHMGTIFSIKFNCGRG